MISVLPKRALDDTSGEIFVSAYKRMLGHYPAAAVSYLAEQAIVRCKWFPTVSECLPIIDEWKRNDDALKRMRLAASLVAGEKHIRFDEAMELLAARQMTQEQIDALPDYWKQIASERMYLWWNPDGTFTVRQYRG